MSEGYPNLTAAQLNRVEILRATRNTGVIKSVRDLLTVADWILSESQNAKQGVVTITTNDLEDALRIMAIAEQEVGQSTSAWVEEKVESSDGNQEEINFDDPAEKFYRNKFTKETHIDVNTAIDKVISQEASKDDPEDPEDCYPF